MILNSAARKLEARGGEGTRCDFSDGDFGFRGFERDVGWETLRSDSAESGEEPFERSQREGWARIDGEVVSRGGGCGFGAARGFMNLSSGLIVWNSDFELLLRV